MLGLGLDINKSGGSFGGVSYFNLPNALHEWNIQAATLSGSTVTIPDSGSIGGLTLINPTAAQLPAFSTIGGKQSIIGDGTDDVVSDATVSDFRGADTTGVMHFVFRTGAAPSQDVLLSVSKSGVVTDRCLILSQPTGEIRAIFSSGGTNTILTGATPMSNNTNYVFSVWSTGTILTGYLGTALQFSSAGASGIRWFGNIAGTTTGLELLSREIGGAFYTDANQAYVCYTPYVSDAAALADQALIAAEYGITV